MKTPEILTPQNAKRRRKKGSKFKARKLVETLQNGVLKEDDASSWSSEAGSKEDQETSLQISSDSCKRTKGMSQKAKKTNIIAIDCEMVGVGDEMKSALARCSVVNYEGHVIYDSFVKPEKNITDFRTQWSGIRPTDMANAISFRKARRQAKRLIKGRVLVGHSLQSDMNVLKLRHPHHLIRDTSKFVPLREMAGFYSGLTPSLKNLTRSLLQTEIQTSEHCSIEDAQATMLLYRHCENEWENEMKEMESASYLCDAYWPSWTKTK